MRIWLLVAGIKTSFQRLFLEGKELIPLFIKDLNIYLQKKARSFGENFEHYKGYLVELLMAKRGRYQNPFLNVSLFVLVAAGILAAPHLSSYYPTVRSSLVEGEVLSSVAPLSASVTSLDFEEISMVTQISDKPRDQVVDYEIQEGDTLSSIAQKFDVSEDTIKWANDLKGKNPILKPGEILKIPPVAGIVHKVKRGETVYSIAERYQSEAQKIVNFPFNDFVDLDNFTLAVGQTLIVPDGVPPAEKPAVRPTAPQYLAGGGGKFLFPTTGNISQQPVWYHMALDISNKGAPDVFAAEGGKVSLAECQRWGYGCYVIVDHPGGVQTLYAHLAKYYVSIGENISRGEALGQMGSTGRSTGPHLHFEVREGGRIINPWPYLR